MPDASNQSCRRRRFGWRVQRRDAICLIYKDLRPDETRVEAARDGTVSGSFDDSAPVREESHFVGVAPELQDEVIVLDPAVGCEARVKVGERYRPTPFVDLH